MKRLISYLSMAFSVSFTVGCFSGGGDVSFESEVDYANSRIVVLGQGVANGNSFLYVEVHVLNSDDTPVVNFMPDLNVTNASLRSCSKTNAAGVARCAITSHEPGMKQLSVLNIFGEIAAQAMFSQPLLSKSIVSNVPGSTISNATASGHQVSASLSNLQAPLKYEHPSGHIIYSTVQGIVLSEE